MIGRIDADRESIHGLARPWKPVEFGHQPGHALPKLRRLRLRDAGVPDETPQLALTECRDRLPGSDIEVVEVPRHVVAIWALLDPDVEHPRSAAVEALFDRPHPSCPHHRHQTGFC